MAGRVVAIAIGLGAACRGVGGAQPAAEQRAGSGALDGKTFFGHEARGKGAPENQIYIFAHGTFEARRWAAAGLLPGAYTSRVEAEKVTFEALTPGRLATGASARWHGTVAGSPLKVQAVVPF